MRGDILRGEGAGRMPGLEEEMSPTRTTDLSCGAGHEQRRADASLANSAYTDNTVRCMVAIKFD